MINFTGVFIFVVIIRPREELEREPHMLPEQSMRWQLQPFPR